MVRAWPSTVTSRSRGLFALGVLPVGVCLVPPGVLVPAGVVAGGGDAAGLACAENACAIPANAPGPAMVDYLRVDNDLRCAVFGCPQSRWLWIVRPKPNAPLPCTDGMRLGVCLLFE